MFHLKNHRLKRGLMLFLKRYFSTLLAQLSLDCIDLRLKEYFLEQKTSVQVGNRNELSTKSERQEITFENNKFLFLDI